MGKREVYFCDVCHKQVSHFDGRLAGIKISGGTMDYAGGMSPSRQDREALLKIDCFAIGGEPTKPTDPAGYGSSGAMLNIPASHTGGLLFCGIDCLESWFSDAVELIRKSAVRAAKQAQAQYDIAWEQRQKEKEGAANMGPSENSSGSDNGDNIPINNANPPPSDNH